MKLLDLHGETGGQVPVANDGKLYFLYFDETFIVHDLRANVFPNNYTRGFECHVLATYGDGYGEIMIYVGDVTQFVSPFDSEENPYLIDEKAFRDYVDAKCLEEFGFFYEYRISCQED